MKIFYYLLIFSILTSCEDIISLQTQAGKQQVVIDAWLTDEAAPQTIKLSYSQGYFDQSTPMWITNALVEVRLGNERYVFEEKQKGHYTFDASRLPSSPFGQEGKPYELLVKVNELQFRSQSVPKRVPSIDSLVYENFDLPVQTVDTLPKSGFLAQFYARDRKGAGDTYWVRFARNDVWVNSPSNIIIAYDGAFSPSENTDGIIFIPPIRLGINIQNVLYQDGDKLTVQLRSVPTEAYAFLQQVRQQSTNAGIFSTPSSNLITNLQNVDKASDNQPLGFFAISRVSTLSTSIKKEKAAPLR